MTDTASIRIALTLDILNVLDNWYSKGAPDELRSDFKELLAYLRAESALGRNSPTITAKEAGYIFRWAASQRAIKRWQSAHPGNDLVWPDHADLCVWLMEQHDEQRRELDEAKGELAQAHILIGDVVAAMNVRPLITLSEIEVWFAMRKWLVDYADHASAPAPREKGEGEWRCFHCDEVFTDHQAAQDHFGPNEFSDPACAIDAAEYRRMEETCRRYCAEDTDLHRALYAKSVEMGTAVRRAEELGYARGLEDAKKHPETLGLVAAPPSGDAETPCEKRDDGLHCECWYGGNTCCACGDGDRKLGEMGPTCAEVRSSGDAAAKGDGK